MTLDDDRLAELRAAAARFFDEATSFRALNKSTFLAGWGLTGAEESQVFPREEWWALQDEWALGRIRHVMGELFPSASIREHFSVCAILRRLQGSGIIRETFMRLAKAEWEELRSRLPTARQKVLATIRRLVLERIPLREFTWERIRLESGVAPNQGRWLTKAMGAARSELLLVAHAAPQIPTLPEGTNILKFDWGWVDPSADVWDLRGGGGSKVKRKLLRPDIAEIAWGLMREDLISGHFTGSTLTKHYVGYQGAAELLGADVPDIKRATLEAVQKAWAGFTKSVWVRKRIRSVLVRLFARLFEWSRSRQDIDGREMLLIAGWLATVVSVKARPSDDHFLSNPDLDAVIEACLLDVRQGWLFAESQPDMVELTTRSQIEGGAGAVVRWGVALMILVMIFTGLRRQSVLEMKLGDWIKIRPGWRILAWRHGKKREEKALVLPDALGELLDQYVKLTSTVREALRSDYVFLTRDAQNTWRIAGTGLYLKKIFRDFVKRHALRCGEGLPLNITCRILRRTYTTRELYEGRSIWALRLQLGHKHISSTVKYGKLDLYEHPALVGPALDNFGRKSLTLWHAPIHLESLSGEERVRLLNTRMERDQEVGLCRHDDCLKIAEGGLPPCSLCEHLVTGPEFLPAWERERLNRESEISAIRTSEGAASLLAQKTYQYEQFTSNMEVVVRGETEEVTTD